MAKSHPLLPTFIRKSFSAIGLTLALALALTLTPSPTFAQEYFEINRFHSNIQIHKDGQLTVTEQIDLTFSSARHGIFRDLPTEGIAVDVLSVTNADGVAQPYETNELEGGLELKIGHPDIYVEGEQTYQITYQVQDAIRSFEDHDELYWNVTGTDWPVSIAETLATLTLPGELQNHSSAFQYQCFTGAWGSTEEACEHELSEDQKVHFRSTRTLNANEGLTLVFGFPKGVLSLPTTLQLQADPKRVKAYLDGELACETPCIIRNIEALTPTLELKKWGFQTFKQNLSLKEHQANSFQFELQPTFWLYLLKIIGFGLLLLIALEPIFTFRKKGRDPKGRGTIIPEYDSPDGIIPAEMGTLYDETVHPRDLTATIVDLCVRKYMKIQVLPKEGLFKKQDYQLIRLNNKAGWEEGLSEFERVFMKRIFHNSGDRKLSDLKDQFYKHLPELKKMLYQNLVEKGYMPKNPNTVRGLYFAKGFVLFFLGFMAGGMAAAFQLSLLSLSLPLVLIFNGLLTLVLAYFMPQKTARGKTAYDHILGFKLYLETAEKDRVKFQEKEHLFYEFLPYAMTFDIAEKWSKAFENIYKTPPEWYTGDPSLSRFDPIVFTHQLDHMAGQMRHALTSHPSSSSGGSSGFSGGFSGGGSGGGGGGSW